MLRSEADYFAEYWRCVTLVLGCNPKTKTSAIRMGGTRPVAFNGPSLITELMATMRGHQWSRPVSDSGGNWAWRSVISEPSTLIGEVALERRIVERGGLADWTYQMSTSSGLHGPRSGTRRAIDLVRRIDGDHYVFIELKVASDNPLYAACEVLGYGLAYLQARLHGLRGSGANDVMLARRIDLVVLAPSRWFGFVQRNGRWVGYDFGALVDAINEGLGTVLTAESSRLPQHMQLRLVSFKDPPGSNIEPSRDPSYVESAAEEIVAKSDLSWARSDTVSTTANTGRLIL